MDVSLWPWEILYMRELYSPEIEIPHNTQNRNQPQQNFTHFKCFKYLGIWPDMG